MERVDLYAEIHKSQRVALFDLVPRAGSTAPGDGLATTELVSSITSMIEELYRHAEAEEQIVHPLLVGADDSVLYELHDEHVLLDGYLGELARDADAVRRDESPAVLQELHRSLARFTAGYLFHIAHEEDEGTPALQAAYTDDQLSAVLVQFQRAHLQVAIPAHVSAA